MAAGLLELGQVFAVLAIAGAVALRIGLSVIPLYVVSGMLAGPFVAGRFGVPHVPNGELLTVLAEVGIVLLLFFLGLEFSLDRLLAARSRITRAGVVDVAINLPLGIAIGLALGWSVVEALLLGGIVYISSSAIITKSLIDMGWIADPESEAILGVLVFEDIVVAVYLAVVAAVAVGASGGGGGTADLALSVGRSLAVLAVLVALAAYGTPLLNRLLDTRSDEQLLIRVVAAAAGVGGLALAFGVSEAVAAFFLGAAFGATEHVHRIERVITSERDLYAAVFFLSIGIETNPALIAGVAVPLAALVVVTTASKLLSGYYGGRAYGLSERRSTRVALALVARGEFSLVIAALATRPDIALPQGETIVALAVGYVLVMGLLGTVLMRYSGVIEGRVVKSLG